MTAKAPIHLMLQSVSVQRPTKTVDDVGSPVSTFAAHLSDVSAHVEPAGGSEAIRYGRRANARMFTVWLPGDTDLDEQDRIVWGANVLEVRTIDDLQNRGVVLKAVCEQVV
jgi:head-tail adaptor